MAQIIRLILVMMLLVTLVMGAVVYNSEYEQEGELSIQKRKTTMKNGFTFITTDLGGGKFKCECISPKGRKIWPGACGSYDKTLGFINCV